MANAFAFGLAVEPGTPDQLALTVVERNDDENTSFVIRRTLTKPVDDSVEAVAEEVQGRLAEDPYTARSSVVVHVDNAAGNALADALTERGVRPVRVRVRSGEEGASAESEEETTIDARDEVFALSDAHRTGVLRLEHRSTEDADRLARTLGHLIDDSSEGSEVDAAYLDVQGMSALLAYWWSTEQTNDPTERLRADLPGTETAHSAP
ncbi:MAG: hypothetical protein R6U20_01530 [Longimonas sp.]|uniref:hypothetical protein n=1 Tax=Longimonas sp. TaxID=2039626 RepID=UPI003975AF7E